MTVLHRAVLALSLLGVLALSANSEVKPGDGVGSGDAGLRSLAGSWEGPTRHPDPALNGTLALSITQTGHSVAGRALWTFPSGTAITGTVLGTAPARGPITYTLDFGEKGTYLYGMTLDGQTLRGTWVSGASPDVSGTSVLARI